MIQTPAEEPWIIDDGTCDVCDETALPFDANDEIGFCAQHSIEVWTDWAFEDFEIDPENERDWEIFKTQRDVITQDDLCWAFEGECALPIARIKDHNALPHMLFGTAELCPNHSVDYIYQVGMLDPQEWLNNCDPTIPNLEDF